MNLINLTTSLSSILKESWLTSWELIKITIPVAIITKLLEELGLIHYIGIALEPLMNLVGLPGELGLVWATAMLTNLYGGIAVFATVGPALSLSGAQVTVLCSMMLIAHALPIELSVSKRAGANLLPIATLRLIGALVYGYSLHRTAAVFQLWQEPATIIFSTSSGSDSLLTWFNGQIVNLALIVLIIFAIVLAMRLLRLAGVLGLLERLLSPVLPWFGMGNRAAPITVVGMIMGIGYGGALIIRETAKGEMDKAEIFNSMVLMGLCHGLVEDTMVMMAIGGKLGGILWGRIVFSLVVAFCIARILKARRNRLQRITLNSQE